MIGLTLGGVRWAEERWAGSADAASFRTAAAGETMWIVLVAGSES
jgi:hypothetical protein